MEIYDIRHSRQSVRGIQTDREQDRVKERGGDQARKRERILT